MKFTPSLLLLALAVACDHSPRATVDQSPDFALDQDTLISDDLVSDGLAFSITAIGALNEDTLKFLASWDSAGQHTQFEIVLLTASPNGSSPFAFSNGWLIARSPSRSEYFLKRLAALHGVSPFFNASTSVDSLPISHAVLGRDLSRGEKSGGGGFRTSPRGPWTCIKLFLGDGEPELFLNINTRNGIAEFSEKDASYGPQLLPILASVLEAP